MSFRKTEASSVETVHPEKDTASSPSDGRLGNPATLGRAKVMRLTPATRAKTVEALVSGKLSAVEFDDVFWEDYSKHQELMKKALGV